MPMPFKKTAQTDNDQDETAEPQTCYAFRFRAYWFVLAQTEGEDTYTPGRVGERRITRRTQIPADADAWLGTHTRDPRGVLRDGKAEPEFD